MAHNLSIQDGFVEMAFTGDTPWHSLGTETDGLMTVTEALEKSRLDWPVMKVPAFIETESNGKLELPDTFGTYRTFTNPDTGEVKALPLTQKGKTLGRTYRVYQNADTFAFLDELLQEQEAVVEVCGALGNGEVVWVLAKLPGHIIVGDGDVVAKYLLIQNSHDGSTSLRIIPTTIRVVCNNTLSMAMAGGVKAQGGICIRHTSKMGERVEEARAAIGIANTRFHQWGESANELIATKVTKKQAEDYFIEVIEAEAGESGEISKQARRTVDSMMKLLSHKTMKGAKAGRGINAWQMVNAVTRFYDFEGTHFVTGPNVGKVNVARKESALFGGNANRKLGAWQLAVASATNDDEKAWDDSLTLKDARNIVRVKSAEIARA